jgi:hypothetical protein
MARERRLEKMAGRYSLEQFEADKQARDRKERQEKQNARRAYLAEGGTEAAFERAWPEMREEMRRRRVMDAEREAREGQRASGVSRI